ncbi:hypothetical protein E2C01_037339 [Portunus trituberculatus]|uniref:Uncharacterized protein n=1 Tax=Portunus trituberculatus TaxID=210409 RepID=A0A5B7FDR2_PORTR|nr:hypothetical protein [Portunus trituberculatus]
MTSRGPAAEFAPTKPIRRIIPLCLSPRVTTAENQIASGTAPPSPRHLAGHEPSSAITPPNSSSVVPFTTTARPAIQPPSLSPSLPCNFSGRRQSPREETKRIPRDDQPLPRINHYHRFIPQATVLLAPLNDLLKGVKKNSPKPLDWGKRQSAPFKLSSAGSSP